MRYRIVMALFAVGLGAAPAFAESAGNAGSDQNTSPDRAAHNRSVRDLQSAAALEQSLAQAGYKNVQISSTAFVVHANAPNGSPVVMMITPDRVTRVINHPVLGQMRVNPQSAQAPKGASGQRENSQQENDHQQ